MSELTPPTDRLIDASDPWEQTVTRDVVVGRTVGEYVVRRRIGSGGMGIVYEAQHPQIGRRVAIKVLRPDRAGTTVRDLLSEARAVSQIRHRHIIDIFGFGQLDGVGQYLVMDFLEGTPLDEELRERAPLSASETLPILDDTLAALSAAHAKGVVHRDLKPGNLFLVSESSGTRYVKVLDFGLAKSLAPAPDGQTRLTRDGTTVGTPEYISPEQACAAPVDGRSDLYALGVIAFEMLTGTLPFTGSTPMAIALGHVNRPPPLPRSIEPSIPAPLETLVLQLLAKEPAARPATADVVRAELKRIQRTLARDDTRVGSPAPKVKAFPDESDTTPLEVPAVGVERTRIVPPPADAAASTAELTAAVAPTPVESSSARAPETPLERPPSRRAPLLGPLVALAAVALAAAVLVWQLGRQGPSPDPKDVEPRPSPAAPPLPQRPVQRTPPPPSRRPEPRPVKAEPGSLRVIAHGCAMDLTVDDAPQGQTPLNSLSLAPGEHRIILHNSACAPSTVERRVTITSGKGETLTLDFTPVK